MKKARPEIKALRKGSRESGFGVTNLVTNRHKNKKKYHRQDVKQEDIRNSCDFIDVT